MDKAQQLPARDQGRLGLNNAPEQRQGRRAFIGRARIVSGQGVLDQARQGFPIVARGKELQRSDAQVAGGHPGQNRAGLHAPADHLFSAAYRGQSAGARHAQSGHGLAHQVFAQHRAEGGAPVAPA